MGGAIKKYFVFAVILSVLGGILIFSINWSNNKSFKTIKIHGLVSLKEKDILSSIDSSVFKTPKNNLKLSKIKDKLMLNKMIESVVLSSGSNDDLMIDIIEKSPVSLVLIKDKMFFANKTGDSLSNDLGKYYADLPLIRISKLENFEDSISLNNLNRFLLECSSNQSKILSELFFINNELHITLNYNGIKVNLGKYEDSKRNFNKLTNFLDKKKDLNLSKITYIDARWNKQIVVNEIN
jgi:cell division septal protein FtsQ